jgi:hypothetical protein
MSDEQRQAWRDAVAAKARADRNQRGRRAKDASFIQPGMMRQTRPGCQVKACAFPPGPDGLCGEHSADDGGVASAAAELGIDLPPIGHKT